MTSRTSPTPVALRIARNATALALAMGIKTATSRWATPAYPSALYLNPGHDARWIGLDLVLERGVTAMGAWIEVDVDAADGGTRALYRTLNTGGSFGSSSLRQEIRLGAAKSICEVRIT